MDHCPSIPQELPSKKMTEKSMAIPQRETGHQDHGTGQAKLEAMMMFTKTWPGLFPAVRRFFLGEAQPTKAKRHGETSIPTISSYNEGMHRYYRWFRQDARTRKCVLTNAYFTTMTAGFETTLEATSEDIDAENYTFVKERVDEFNKRVNIDLALFVSQVKRNIYGKAGFEIVLDENEGPARLISLQSDKLKPNVSEDWGLTAFRYEGRDGFYDPYEVLYFINLPLEADYECVNS